jgi:lysophospholipase
MNQAFDRRVRPAGAAFGTWRAPDGWSYRHMDWPRPDGAPLRGSLLFAGGRGDFIEKYLEVFAYWQSRGWNVTAFDWRGQGGSRGNIAGGHLDSLDSLVDDLAALIGEWREEGAGPHVAIGHSMGGHVLLRTLAERRPRLDGAVLVAPMLTINAAPLPSWGAPWIASFLSLFGWRRHPAWRQPVPPPPPGSVRQTILTGSRERYEDELWWWEQEPGYNLGAPSWGWLEAAYRSSALLNPAKLGAIDVPVLLIGTDRDRLVSPAAIRRAAAFIPGAELAMIERSGHEILREGDEVRLAALARIDAFLDRRAGR